MVVMTMTMTTMVMMSQDAEVEVMRLVPAKVNRVDINSLLFSLDFKLTVDSVKSEDQVKRALALFIHMIYNFLEWRS